MQTEFACVNFII